MELGLVLLDLTMPHLSGEDLLEKITQDFPDVPVIIITGANELDTAVRCMKGGAFDYMVKPIEKTRLVSGVSRAIELRETQRENMLLSRNYFSDGLEHPEAFSDIISANKQMRSIFQYCESTAGTSQPVLITGETGVGKEMIAKSIHRLSGRKGNFIAVNVSGLDDNMFSDTLLGHVKGAFTGADQLRMGLIEKAADGTLFLDEIGDLSHASQVKLLRLAQEREYFPLGSDVMKRSNARLVVATNQDIEALQRSGGFRKDLYFRLCSHHINIPSLRERKDDLQLLAEFFLKKAAQSLGRKKPSAPKELVTLLSTYHFPGNVRELETMLFDAVSNHKSGKLSLDRLKRYILKRCHSPSSAVPKPSSGERDALISFSACLPTLRKANNALIAEALKRTNGNQSMAAQLLGITRQTLNRHLKRLTIDERVKGRKLGSSLADLPELGQGAQPGSKKSQVNGKTREFLVEHSR
jgi:DNA-binding NtrC family response regulator